jgi:uncharacterized protein
VACVGLLTLELRIQDARSLKDRRQVVRSVKQRLRNRFNVAVAELDPPLSWTLATVGVSAVGQSAAIVEEILSRVEADAAEILGADLADSSIELF